MVEFRQVRGGEPLPEGFDEKVAALLDRARSSRVMREQDRSSPLKDDVTATTIYGSDAGRDFIETNIETIKNLILRNAERGAPIVKIAVPPLGMAAISGAVMAMTKAFSKFVTTFDGHRIVVDLEPKEESS